MKLYFITTYEARNVKNWSGIPYYMVKSLKDAGVEIEFIDNLQSLPRKDLRIKLRHLFYNKILGKKLGNYIGFYEPANLRFIAKQVEKKLKNKKGGIIFSPGTIPIAYLKTEKPIIFWTDAIFAVMENYYSEFTGLSKRTIHNCNQYEKNALKRAGLAIYSSEWAANSAIKDYGTDPNKVKFIPFGANLECGRTKKDITNNNNEKSRTICKLLFIGKDWERKGGNEAVRVAKELNKLNIQTELTIVGCIPPKEIKLPEYIKVKGYINKSEKDGAIMMDKLYSESHFFILPTRAECFGIVFSEANSFGLPVITTNTGGIASAIKNDINGRMFGSELDIPSCVMYIAQIFNNYELYNKLSHSSFNEYLVRLNWQVSMSKCISYMKSLEKENIALHE